MLRERLKEIDLKITELADYLQISRPTMYKFIEYYDDAKFKQINHNILLLFNYISENELVGKKNVLNYIISNIDTKNINEKQEKDISSKIRNYVLTNPQSKMTLFINNCLFDSNFSDIVFYLADIYPILKKKKISVEDKNNLKLFKEIKEKLKNTEE